MTVNALIENPCIINPIHGKKESTSSDFLGRWQQTLIHGLVDYCGIYIIPITHYEGNGSLDLDMPRTFREALENPDLLKGYTKGTKGRIPYFLKDWKTSSNSSSHFFHVGSYLYPPTGYIKLDEEPEVPEVRYGLLRPKMSGQGHTGNALKLYLQGLAKTVDHPEVVCAWVDPTHNPASHRILEKNGFFPDKSTPARPSIYGPGSRAIMMTRNI